jgi:short-chain fatty acids transporter
LSEAEPFHNPLSRLGIRLAEASERWFPDAFVFAVIGVLVIFGAAVLIEHRPPTLVASSFGGGFWNEKLIVFTMQMVLIIVSGYAVATSPPIHRAITWLALRPRSARQAVGLVALFSMLSSLLSWSFSLIFSGLLAKAIAARTDIRVDYRAMGAAAFLGLGSVWALGLSSSAALLMSTPPDSLRPISGVIPLSATLFLWQSMLMALVLMTASILVAVLSTPPEAMAVDARAMGVELDVHPPEGEPPRRPGEWLEHSPLLTILLSAIGFTYLAGVLASGGVNEILELKNYILLLLLVGLALHWRPRSFIRAVSKSMPATAGIVIQYPLYAGMLQMMLDSGLAHDMAHAFVSLSTRHTYPLLVSAYSGVLGMFVPSAGGKWLIEAPYLLEAARTLHVNMGWVVQIYNAAEALPNLIHPFWMLPLLGILGLRARDLVGYTSLQFVVHTPLVFLMVWLFNYTLPYIPPEGLLK